MKIIITVLAVLILSGSSCAHRKDNISFTPTTINLAEIDFSLLSDCNLPTNLPKKKLTQAEVEKYWGIDRKNLVSCAKKHGFLVQAIKFRDALVKNNKTTPKEEKGNR